eukprot:scaffold55216_cov21-Tisochrysis_lutea.AAC.1
MHLTSSAMGQKRQSSPVMQNCNRRCPFKSNPATQKCNHKPGSVSRTNMAKQAERQRPKCSR